MISNRYILLLLPLIVYLACHKNKIVAPDSKIAAINNRYEGHWSTKDSISQLHHAVLMEDKERVKYLLENGADVMNLDADGETALMYACNADSIDFDIVSLLIEYGSDILYEKQNDFNSAFFICIKNSKDSLMLFLLDNLSLKEKELLKSKNYYLTLSIGFFRSKIVEKLIPFQSDLNAYSLMGSTFLQYTISQAVSFDSNNKSSDRDDRENYGKVSLKDVIEVINLLLSNGADINKDLEFSYNVVNALDSPAIFNLLLEKGLDLSKPVEKLIGVNEKKSFSILDLFIDRVSTGVVFNIGGQYVDITKDSDLKLYLKALDLMIAKGARGKSSPYTAYEQLMLAAVDKSNTKVVDLLLSQDRVATSFKDKTGKTLLMRAQALDNYETIEVLKKYN